MCSSDLNRFERPPRKSVTFRIEAGAESAVFLAGSFNNWDPAKHRLRRVHGNGTHAITLLLPVGQHEYKFIVDGEWQADPACPTAVPNEHGTTNSVVEVR